MKRKVVFFTPILTLSILCAWLVATNLSFADAPQETEMDNARVVEMTKMGLGDDIIIARIRIAHTKFSLGDNDLLDLKKGGVSEKVIAAMLEASVLKIARVKVDGNPVELHTLGQAKTGGRLGAAFSYGIKSVKQKAYLQGQHASVVVSSNPVIEMELPPDDSIEHYILVKLDPKSDRRELEVGSMGGVVGAKTGVRAESVIKTSYESLGGRRYKITTHGPIKGGEYILYVLGSADTIKGIFGRGYDFTVE
jgi:hypothetical protein